jgi:high-affinity Fe2+/Pb2+ permease
MEPGDSWKVLMSMLELVSILIGLRRAFQENNPYAISYVSVLVVFPLVYYFSFTEMSYRHPIDPFVAIRAAYGAINSFPGWNQKRTAGGREAASF